MKSNPPILSRLGCGGLLLLLLGLICLPWTLLWLAGQNDIGLNVGDEGYRFSEIWWLMTPLAVASVIAVFRLGFGYRDWLAPIVAGVWTLIGAGYAVGTQQFALLVLGAFIFLLITTGTIRDRQWL